MSGKHCGCFLGICVMFPVEQANFDGVYDEAMCERSGLFATNI